LSFGSRKRTEGNFPEGNEFAVSSARQHTHTHKKLSEDTGTGLRVSDSA